MADSEALRSRRKRSHAAGDHSLCRRCALVRDGKPPPPPAITPASVSDPRAALRELARQLAVAYSADTGNALLARELRMTLQALIPAAKPKADGELEELFAAL